MKVTTNGKQESIVKFLKKHLDIKSKNGLEWQALCPYHEDNSPSFSVNIRKGLFICYACGAKGNMEQLAEHLNTDVPLNDPSVTLDEVVEALEKLTVEETRVERPIVGIPYPAKYQTEWATESARNYFTTRGLTEIAISDYRLGYDIVDSDAIIPLCDIYGRIAGFIKRTLDSQKLAEGVPKYRYPKGLSISKYLYGADVIMKNTMYSETHGHPLNLVITEGSIDAMSVYKICSQTYGVAILGARISKEQALQVQKLAPTTIVIATDRDRAGREAEVQVKYELDKLRMGVKIVCASWDSQYGKDLAELSPTMRVEVIKDAIG
jgi:DNA primase